jgi:hypothetical protein
VTDSEEQLSNWHQAESRHFGTALRASRSIFGQKLVWAGISPIRSLEPMQSMRDEKGGETIMTKGSRIGKEMMGGREAARIQSAGARNPDSPTAQSGFGPRAQSAADHNATGQAPAAKVVKLAASD